MKDRCYNPKSPAFKYYGARGVSICSDWKTTPDLFFIWSMQNGYKENLSIERKNNDGNYSPENCKWATRLEQTINRRNTKFVIFSGQKLTMMQAANEIGMDYGCFYNRIKRGQKPDEICKL